MCRLGPGLTPAVSGVGAGPRTQAVGFALLKTPGRRGPGIGRKGMLKGQWDEIETGNRAPRG